MLEVLEQNGRVQTGQIGMMPPHALATKVKQQQLLLEMYQSEWVATKDPLRRDKLEDAMAETSTTLWGHRVLLARTRLQGWQPAPPQKGAWLSNTTFNAPRQFVGRSDANQIVQDWFLHEPSSPLLAVVGAGGMGKSALAWHWVNSLRQQGQAPPLVVWWQFNRQSGGLAQLVAMLLRQFGDNLNQFSSLRQANHRLLQWLQKSPVLLILDGIEQLLWGFQADIKEEVPAEIKQQWASAEAEQLIMALATPGVTKAQTLVTAQLLPASFQTLPTTARLHLPGLPAHYARQLLGIAGISPDTPQLDNLIQAVGGQPLTLKLLGGHLSRAPKQIAKAVPMLVDRLSLLPLSERWETILRAIHSQMPRNGQRLLTFLAYLEEPVTEASLSQLVQEDEKLPAFDVPPMLDLLCQSQLVQKIERKRAIYYDVRGTVKRFVLAQEAVKVGVKKGEMPASDPDNKRTDQPPELSATIDLYRQLARSGQFEEALNLYRDRLSHPLYFQFGAHKLEIELLSKLLTNDEKKRPRLRQEVDQAWVLNSLAGSYTLAGQAKNAVIFFERSNALYQKLGNRRGVLSGLGDMAQSQIALGQLRDADKNLRESLILCRQLDSPFQAAISHQWRGYLLAIMGDWSGAAAELDAALQQAKGQNHVQLEGMVWLQGANAALIQGRHQTALSALEQAESCFKQWGQIDAASGRQWAEYYHLLAWALVLTGDLETASVRLKEAKRRAAQLQMNHLLLRLELVRVKLHFARIPGTSNLPLTVSADELRQKIWVALGRVQRQAQANEMALVLADVHNLMAEVAISNGKKELAMQHSEQAYNYGWCNAPPYTYDVGVKAAQKIEKKAQRNHTKLFGMLTL